MRLIKFIAATVIVAAPAVAHAQGTMTTISQDTTHSEGTSRFHRDSTRTKMKHHDRIRPTTNAGKMHTDSSTTSGGDVVDDATRNQTQSGMKDKAGHSTLGHRAKMLTPTQNQPVMAKGDTLRRAHDAHAGREEAGRNTGDSTSTRLMMPPNDSTTPKQP